MDLQQLEKIERGRGFLAALDQSGGSTPKALAEYGIGESQYSGEGEMFDRVHEMRTRVFTSPAFRGDRILGTILFEQTMDRQVDGQDTGAYLWGVKGVVPFLKVDKGLAQESDGVQLMKPVPAPDELLDRAAGKGMFGTKARSFIARANKDGIGAVVDQQFELAGRVLAKGLVPILEPEVDIHSPDKPKAEALLLEALLDRLETVDPPHLVMLKVSLPSADNFYGELVDHPRVLRLLALSGGYSRADACAILARNTGMIASFSRALAEGLSAQQSDDEFNRTLDASIQAIYEASRG
jgi:fructose-bisphosphate aldolase class I